MRQTKEGETEELIHHSDRGVQYLSIRYAERLQEVGIEPSVGSVGGLTQPNEPPGIPGRFSSLARGTFAFIRGVAEVMCVSGTFEFTGAQISDDELCQFFSERVSRLW